MTDGKWKVKRRHSVNCCACLKVQPYSSQQPRSGQSTEDYKQLGTWLSKKRISKSALAYVYLGSIGAVQRLMSAISRPVVRQPRAENIDMHLKVSGGWATEKVVTHAEETLGRVLPEMSRLGERKPLCNANLASGRRRFSVLPKASHFRSALESTLQCCNCSAKFEPGSKVNIRAQLCCTCPWR